MQRMPPEMLLGGILSFLGKQRDRAEHDGGKWAGAGAIGAKMNCTLSAIGV